MIWGVLLVVVSLVLQARFLPPQFLSFFFFINIKIIRITTINITIIIATPRIKLNESGGSSLLSFVDSFFHLVSSNGYASSCVVSAEE